jgi:DNA-binding NtrC family response regulator
MRTLEPVVARLATAAMPVLIRGELGVGKEGVALAIHYLSDRARRAFVKVPCAGLPADVLETELANMVTAAGTGTLFLHEVAEMSIAAQGELGQHLDTSAGAFRVLASTSIDMYARVAAGRFRRDLYERLAIVTVDVPPLRERREEIDQLVPQFLERYARAADRPVPPLTDEMVATLRSYSWPGNIRELENVVKRWVLLGTADPIRAELAAHQAARVRGRRASLGVAPGLRDIARVAAREAERSALQEALRRAKGNRAAVARELKVSYKTLLQKQSDVGLATTPRRRQKL